jgi:hypothetical protein
MSSEEKQQAWGMRTKSWTTLGGSPCIHTKNVLGQCNFF